MPANTLLRRGFAPNTGIVHFGPGAFFRAFNAIYTDQAMALRGGDWGITAVSLKSATARDQLGPQDGLYTSCTLAPEGAQYTVISAINQVLVAPEDPAAVIALLAQPGVRIVSLTITEKGYGFNPGSGGMDPAHPDLSADLANREAPRSAIGFITAALARRRADGTPPFTVMSCDNLPDNGAATRAVLLDFARQIDPDLADWIAETVPFPSSMVDRITPATTAQDIAALDAAQGYEDPALVVHEPFRQWVIEDDFAMGRPAWDKVGAQMVGSVQAHELMKLRCLNGTHSTLAYLGYLAGHETIAQTVADAPFAALCEALWRDEILPTVPQPQGEDLPAYAAALLERYRNPAIQHRTWQIAMDGSQKLPQRLLGTIADRLAAGAMPRGLILAVAGWMRYVRGVDETGAVIEVKDPMADTLRACTQTGDGAAQVAAFLALSEIFPEDLAAHAGFKDALIKALAELEEHGARACVAAYLA